MTNYEYCGREKLLERIAELEEQVGCLMHRECPDRKNCEKCKRLYELQHSKVDWCVRDNAYIDFKCDVCHENHRKMFSYDHKRPGYCERCTGDGGARLRCIK